MKGMNLYIKTSICCLGLMALITSCLNTNDVEKTSECAITAISIADIKSTIHTTAYDGTDSTYTRTMSGKEIRFNIDQINGIVTTIDSLPNWVDLTRVVPTITCYGTPCYMNPTDSVYYAFANGADSLDFSAPANILIIGTDGQSYKKYTVKINKRVADSDSLLWTFKENVDLKGDFRLVQNNGKTYFFQKCDTIDFQSATAFNGMLYALNSDGIVCRSEDGRTWKATSLAAEKLLASDNYHLYALAEVGNGMEIVQTADLTSWTGCGSANIDKIPSGNISSVAYSTKTNQSLQNVVMIGNPADKTSKYVPVWYKLSAPDAENDQNWNYIGFAPDNQFTLPVFTQMSNIFLYRGTLYVIGDGKIYSSVDNGISWRELQKKMILPADFSKERQCGVVTEGNYIHLFQSGDEEVPGKEWIGKFNGLAD